MKLTGEKCWRFEYKNIKCKIKFWTEKHMSSNYSLYPSGGIWNSYIFISKKNNPKLFKKLNVEKECNYTKGWEYDQIQNAINMQGGITFYKKIYNFKGMLIALKIGNDYNHIWNTEENEHQIEKDLNQTIDNLIEQHEI